MASFVSMINIFNYDFILLSDYLVSLIFVIYER